MPIIEVEGPALTKDQKRELAGVLTRSASGIMKIPPQAFVVVIKESAPDNVAVGGVLLSERQ